MCQYIYIDMLNVKNFLNTHFENAQILPKSNTLPDKSIS